MWKTCEGKKGSIILLIFSNGGVFNLGGGGLVRLILYTSLRLRIPCNNSLPTLLIYSTSNRRCIWNQVEYLRWSFLAEIVNVLRPLVIFAEEIHCASLTGCLTGFCMRPCPITYYSSEVYGLRRNFLPLELHKGILDSPCLLILLIYANNEEISSTT